MLRYPLYQNTDLPWLAEIPAHWDLKRNKNVFAEMKEEVGGTLRGVYPLIVDFKRNYTQRYERWR